MGADEVILGVGLTYMRIALCFAPCFMLNYTFTAFVRNDGAPNVAMAATLTSGIFNIIFDYVLMFPLGMGMAGAALATGLSPVVSMLICSVHFFSPSNHIRLVRRAPSVRRLVRSCSPCLLYTSPIIEPMANISPYTGSTRFSAVMPLAPCAIEMKNVSAST